MYLLFESVSRFSQAKPNLTAKYEIFTAAEFNANQMNWWQHINCPIKCDWIVSLSGIFFSLVLLCKDIVYTKYTQKKEKRPIELTRTTQREAIKSETTKYEIAIR